MLDDPLIGRQLANYKVERVIRRGGMAQVYYGEDVKLHRPVAIKVIDARYRSNPAYAERFVREAQSVAKWRHENIVQIYYADDEDGLYYYAMEYVDGLDLAQLLSAYTQDGELMPHHDVLHIGRAIANALDFAHQKGVIHRDIKPSNVMVSALGRVLLTDFGLALTVEEGSHGEIFGTPHYIAPEQAHRSADAVPQSDLYSLGVILYEMLTGSVPFDDPSPTSLALQHIQDEPPSPRLLNPQLSEATEVVLLKALRKKPEERYQTGKALLDALEESLAAEGPQATLSLALPPIPAGIQSRTASTVSRLSRLSVVDRIAMQIGHDKTIPLRHNTNEPSPQRRLWLAAGGLLFVLFIALLTLPRLFAAGFLAPMSNPTATATATTVLLASPTLAATATAPATPTATATGTSTATAPPTATSTNTPNPTPTPTNTLTPTPIANRLQLFYDDFSFYVWNPGALPADVSMLAFEAVDPAGAPAGYSFQGRVWTGFYPRLESRACNGLEVVSEIATQLRPFQCQTYNALIRPQADSETIFWINRDNVSQFRVYWQGDLVRTCAVSAGTCIIPIP